ncbi:DUF1775 domain-containing protein [Streptomyces sp. 2A115]|uniref:DUF1775 domain-containing protein n=1 Tax=Streptomyces sp. 2A115 TaxID=3457439 RepID=UPI003FD44789
MVAYPPVRTAHRITLAGAAALTVTLALAAPAAAHAEVGADAPQALAENVTLTFVSEAESDSAGFTELRVVLPEGIAPGDVTPAGAPKDWELKTTADGYTVSGPALRTGVDAKHKIKIRQLPDVREIAFKTVETYSDGTLSRWIELPTGGEEPEQPAPALKLKAAAPGAKPADAGPGESTPPSPAPSADEPTAEAAGSDAGAEAAGQSAGEDQGSSAGMVIGGVLVALLVLGGGAWWLVRRRSAVGSG